MRHPPEPQGGVLSSFLPPVSRIRTAYGFDDATFDQHVVPVVQGLIRHLHDVPAAPCGAYRAAGGAVRMALELGFCSLQAADGRTFAGGDGAPCSQLRHRWRLAALLAGFFAELHGVLGRAEVLDERGEIWPAACIPLRDWLEQTRCARYRVRWRQTAIDAHGLAVHLASRIIPGEVLAHLGEGNTTVVPQLFSCIAGTETPGGGNVLADIVRLTAGALRRRDGEPSSGDMQAAQDASRLPAGDDAARPVQGVAGTPAAPRESRTGRNLDLFAHAEAPDADARSAPQVPDEAAHCTLPVPLRLDCSRIVNPLVRDALAATVRRLDHSFGSMAARLHGEGVFIALSEFADTLADSGLLVRALGEAGLLAAASDAHGKLQRLPIGDDILPGVVIPRCRFSGWEEWAGRWSAASRGAEE